MSQRRFGRQMNLALFAGACGVLLPSKAHAQTTDLPTVEITAAPPSDTSVPTPLPPLRPPLGFAYRPEPLSEQAPESAGRTARIRQTGPRLLFSLGYALAVGYVPPDVTGAVVAFDAGLGVQLNRLISLQAQGMMSVLPYYGRAAAIVGFSVSRVVTVGCGLAATFAPNYTLDAGLAMLSLATELSFLITRSNADPDERRHGFMLSLRLDPGVSLPPYGGYSYGTQPGWFGMTSTLVLGYVTR